VGRILHGPGPLLSDYEREQGNIVISTKRSFASAGSTPRAKGPADPLGVSSEIGRKLKQYYDELVSDDVPDRFAQLLSQLEAAETARKED
jgi:hypothetical protein